jgi:hypothetical protein
MGQNRPCWSPKISPYIISISLRPMSWLILAHCVNKLMLRLLQMQIAVLCAFQAIRGLKQPLERGTSTSKCSRGVGAENGPSRKAGAKIWALRCMVWHSGVLQSLHIQLRLKQHMFRLVTETGTGKKNLVSDYIGSRSAGNRIRFPRSSTSPRLGKLRLNVLCSPTTTIIFLTNIFFVLWI